MSHQALHPRFETLSPKILAGQHLTMSFTRNRTLELWSGFMPRRKEIANQVGTDLYSVEVYPPHFFDDFNPETEFEKWAAVEIGDHSPVPDGMEILEMPAGLYAVFVHKGPASLGAATYEYIFREWLPASGYRIAQRPHFALMGEKYRHESSDSEEEIWIPVDAAM